MKLEIIKNTSKKIPINIKEINKNDLVILKYIFLKKDHLKFIKFSGDDSAIHTDKVFAKNNGFKEPIGHAFFINVLLSKIIGKFYPGGSELCVRSDSYFINPFFINDIFNIKVTVLNKNLKLKSVNLSINITNQKKIKIYQGTLLLNLSLSDK